MKNIHRSIYIPQELDDQLRALAARDRRSVAQLVLHLLEQAVEDRDRGTLLIPGNVPRPAKPTDRLATARQALAGVEGKAAKVEELLPDEPVLVPLP